MASLNDILAVILGGGVGMRLYPLTKERAKPAVPIAGKYRLIDIPLSNCINSNINRIAVLTQFNSVSLHRHINQTYHFDSFHTGWVQIWAAEQTPASTDWYQGTADAVRKQLFEISAAGTDYTLILAGDHLYRMDYETMAEYHWASGADVTVAVQPVSKEDTRRLGILKCDPDGRITDFVEKPKDPQILTGFVSLDDPEKPYLASMGIYLFNTKVLSDLLKQYTFHTDFGADVIPKAIGSNRVFGFEFDGYWQDIGTIRSFYETNLSLASPNSPFDMYDPERPIYTRPRFLPSAVLDGATLDHVLLADGCRISYAQIDHSVIGLRSLISSGSHVSKTIMMGSDYYDPSGQPPPNNMSLGIGPDCNIEGTILDKNIRIGAGVVIRPFPRGTELKGEDWSIRDGIVVVPKGTIIPAGTHIGPESS
jgi:glucose-1-phosphate adenylyltransferase